MSLSILIQVTHLLGAGHLTRAAALATACAARGHRVVLMSGGTPHALLNNASFEAVQLPPVKIEGTAFTSLLTPQGIAADSTYLTERRELAVATVERYAPDVLITELFPFGRRVLAEEFLAVIQGVRAQAKPTMVLASIRDILAAPSRPARVIETEQRLKSHYDAVLVHGDPAFVPLEASWPVSTEIAGMLHYTGYIDNPDMPSHGHTHRSEIIVSGGSSAASLLLYRNAIAAAAQILYQWRILVGQGVSAPDFDALVTTAPVNVIVERVRPDFRALLASAMLSISQCGYNTALDVMGVPVRRLFVPFEADHETEQLLRAETLTKRGSADVLRERDLSSATLTAAVMRLLGDEAPPLALLNRDGAQNSIKFIENLAQGARR